MKNFKLTFMLTILMSMASLQAFADWDTSTKIRVGAIYYILDHANHLAMVTSPPKNPYSSDTPYEYTGNITIPSSFTYNGTKYSVTSIGNYAFEFCTDLTSVTIGNSVTSIGDYAFCRCYGLTSITIPNSVTSIGNYAFNECSGLTSVAIPNSVTSIGDGAFSECSSLTSVTIGNSVTNIGYGVFSECSSLTSVDIPNSVTSIGEEAFFDCDGLTSVAIPNSVTSIGYRAFRDCSGLTSVTIGSGVTRIGGEAFALCFDLTSITIGNSVTSIGLFAFYGCSGLISVTLNSNTLASKAYDADYNIKYIFGEQVTEYIIGDDVTSIGNSAFNGCTGLTSVTIGNSVMSIGNYAFNGCTGLTSVTIGNSVMSIGNYAFSGCTSLTSFTIPNSVTSIGVSAFYNTAWYKNQPNGLVYAGKVAYKYKGTMPANTSISIIDGTLGIAGGAFGGCSGLTSIIIPNSVTSIGDSAFSGCSSLTSITIPNSVTSIGDHAFCDCSGLTSVTIGNSVTSIDKYAFYNCSGLTSVTALNPTPVAISSLVFTSQEKATLYVPNGSKSAYQAAGYWKKFKEIVEIDVNTQFNLTYIVDGEEYKTYKLKGNEVISPEPDPIKEGYTFSGWSEIPSTMPYHDVTINGYFRKNGNGVYKPLDDYIANSVTSLSNNSYYISPTINNVERVYVDLTKSTSNSSYCYIGIKNKVNTKMIDFSSKYLQSTSSDNLVVYEGSNSIRQSIKILANNNTYSWLYYNPENPNEVIIDVKAYFGCSGYIEKWQENFGTSCVVNIETENAETSIHDIRDSSIKDDRYYNLQGQRVLSPKKGIYIINGKKVIIK